MLLPDASAIATRFGVESGIVHRLALVSGNLIALGLILRRGVCQRAFKLSHGLLSSIVDLAGLLLG